ncbi:MAG: hypothetical protein Q9175_006908 [Cornicularia normoerica]
MRKYALNSILLAIMVGDREQAIDIEATIEVFLSGQIKDKVFTRLPDVCYDTPFVDQLGEQKKREALGAFLADKEAYVREGTTQSPLRSAAEDLAHQSPEDPSDLAGSFSIEHDGNDGHNFGRVRKALSALWDSAVHKFVISDSTHKVLRRTDNLWIAGCTNQAAVQSAESGC